MVNPLPAQPEERIVVLGKVRGPVGLAGWVKVQSHTQPSENILSYRTWQLKLAGGWQPMKVAEGRGTGDSVQARFEGHSDRNGVEGLRGVEIGVFRHELPAPEPGQYYLDDLLGFEVFTPAGELLGRLDQYLELPAHPLMSIRGKRQHLVPMVKERLLSVDFEKASIVVDWGLDWS